MFNNVSLHTHTTRHVSPLYLIVYSSAVYSLIFQASIVTSAQMQIVSINVVTSCNSINALNILADLKKKKILSLIIKHINDSKDIK